MKKLGVFIIMLFLCISILPLSVAADDVDPADKVYDYAGLLTDTQVQQLSGIANEMSDLYGMDYVIVTTDSAGGKSPAQYAEDFFVNNGFGRGANSSGFLLFIDMGERDIEMRGFGDGAVIHHNTNIEAIYDAMVSSMSGGQYYSAISTFLSMAKEQAERYYGDGTSVKGEPLPDVPSVDKSALVYDFAGIFTDEEMAALQSAAQEISARQGVDVVILTDDRTYGRGSQGYANDFYNANGFSSAGGVVMLIDLESWYLQVSNIGEMRNILTNDYLDPLIDRLLAKLLEGEYYDAATTFMSNLDGRITRVRDGNTRVTLRDQYAVWQIGLGALGIGFGAALVVVLIMLAAHKKSLSRPSGANQYIQGPGLRLSYRDDRFLRTHTSRTAIPKDNGGGSSGSGSSGGGGSFSSSSSRSSGGGKF